MDDKLKEQMRAQAVRLMLTIGMDPIQVRLFEKHNTRFEFNPGFAFTINPYSERVKKLDEIQREHDCMVYAVMHDTIQGVGECYAYLCVSPYSEDWNKLMIPLGMSQYMLYAYVENVDHNECSESGYALVEVKNGILRRIG